MQMAKSPPKKNPTKLEKAEERAKIMVDNDELRVYLQRQKQIDQYVEFKMNKGYSKEEATRMAEEIISNSKNYD